MDCMWSSAELDSSLNVTSDSLKFYVQYQAQDKLYTFRKVDTKHWKNDNCTPLASLELFTWHSNKRFLLVPQLAQNVPTIEKTNSSVKQRTCM